MVQHAHFCVRHWPSQHHTSDALPAVCTSFQQGPEAWHTLLTVHMPTKQFRTTSVTPCSCARRGVFWDKKSRRWRCQLGFKNKKIFLGYFHDAEEAARAYDTKLVELHGSAGGSFISPTCIMIPKTSLLCPA